MIRRYRVRISVPAIFEGEILAKKSSVVGEVVDVVASWAGGVAPLRVDVACGRKKFFMCQQRFAVVSL